MAECAAIHGDCNRDPLATPYNLSARNIAHHHAQLAEKVSLAASIFVRGLGGRAPCLPHEENGARITHAHGARSMHAKSNTHARYGITQMRT